MQTTTEKLNTKQRATLLAGTLLDTCPRYDIEKACHKAAEIVNRWREPDEAKTSPYAVINAILGCGKED